MLLQALSLVAMVILAFAWRTLFPSPSSERPRMAPQGGVAVLRPPRGRNAMYAGLVLFPVLLIGFLLVRIPWEPSEDEFGLASAAALLCLGGWLVAWFLAAEFRQRVRADASTIDRVFAVTHLQVRWSEVTLFRWNPGARWFFLIAAGAWLWVPADFDGIADFAQLALASLPPAALAADPETRPALEALARLPGRNVGTTAGTDSVA